MPHQSMLHQSLDEFDPEVDSIIRDEEQRQRESLELIASENFTSVAVLQANGSVLTNKYSEGEIGRRYYGGNQNIDRIEQLCQDRALALFGLDPSEWGVNVQTLSGSVANFAVYTGLAGRDGRIMGLDLPSGGHLTHGYQTPKRKISATSIFFISQQYRAEPDGLINYEKLEQQVSDFDPAILICGGSAYPREFDYVKLRKCAGKRILMMDMAHISGMVATGAMDNPFPHCDVVTTTTHKMLRGPRSAMIFYRRRAADGRDLAPLINMAVFPGLQGGPHNQKIAALAVALKQAATPEYREYASRTVENARVLAEELTRRGFRLLTGGTDCHMMLLVLEGVNGAEAEKLCEMVNICLNRNCIVTDSSPLRPTALRLGTPALTTRGFRAADMAKTAEFIDRALKLATELSEEAKNEEGVCDAARFSRLMAADPRVACLKDGVVEFVTGFDIPQFDYRNRK